jgi:hypothetical protein
MSAADEQQKIEQILNRFPGPVTFYSSRAQNAFLTLGFLLAVVAAIGMISFISGTVQTMLILYAGVIYFGWRGLVACSQLFLPQLSLLTLDRGYFRIVKFNQHRAHAWHDVADFSVSQFRSARLILFNSDAETSPLRGINKMFSGKNSGLTETYGFKAETLAELMTRWQEKAVQRQ